MSLDKERFIVLEQLISQLYDVKTENAKRQEIEKLLINFEAQLGSWKLCLEYVALTKNQYVALFCLNAVEKMINKQWMFLPWEEKAQLNSILNSYLLENLRTLAPCIKSKLVKLIVDIARHDWPHLYPDFLTNVLQFLQKPETRYLGLLFMWMTSEEFVAPREDLSVDRKNELKKLLLDQLPQVFSILLGLLSDKNSSLNEQECSLLLRVFSHFFNWVPPDQVPNAVIDILFKLGSNTDNQDVAYDAVNTLNNMLFHWVPPCWNEIINHTMKLLQTLLCSHLENLKDSYLEKVTDFLRLVIRRELYVSLDKQDHLNALVAATLSFTVRQPKLETGFLRCLSIWDEILENRNSAKFQGAFVSLAQNILNKLQFRRNRLHLIKIETTNGCDPDYDEDVDDYDEFRMTSWGRFLNSCMKIVMKIADLRPKEILQTVFEQWIELSKHYEQIFNGSSVIVHDFTAADSLLKDLSVFTQAMGRLCPQCTGESWKEEPYFTLGVLTMQHFLRLHELTAKAQYHSLPAGLDERFENLHAEVLASLKSWCYWLSLLHTEPTMKNFLHDFVTGIVNGCVPLLNPGVSKVLQHCSALLISSITNTVRPSFLWNLESLKCLFSSDLNHLQKKDQYLIRGSLVNCLILKWPDVEDQMWDHRLKLITSYIEELTSPLMAVPLQFDLQFKDSLISTLQILQYIIKLYKSEGMNSKKLLCVAFQKSVEHSLALFPIYAEDAEISLEILQFFLVLLECLQQQVGSAFTQMVVQIFMDVYTRKQLQVSLAHENGGGLQQLFQILDLVVQTPGLSASKLTPMAVNLCIQLSEPILSPDVSPSVQESFFQLVSSVLVHKWHYFFKTTIETELRRKEFLQLMKAIGQSFFLQNLDLLRQNLKTLDKLNTKWGLYRKEIFKRELHAEFLKAFFNILIAKTYVINYEEIKGVVYGLVVVDIEWFSSTFLPKYLDSFATLSASHKTHLLENFRRDMDVAWMMQNISGLINDLIFYQLYSASVPFGPS